MASHPPEKGLPSRQATTAEEDDAVPEFDPSDTVGILQERLQAWKHACGYLEDYISTTEKMQKAHSKEYEKVLKTINSPLKQGHHFDQSLGGIAGLFENMRTNTHAIATSHSEASKALGSSVLPKVARLHLEIKSKSKELAKGAAKGAKHVDTARNHTQQLIERLGEHSAAFDSAGAKITPDNDPYVLHRGIQHRLHKQVLEENTNHDELVAVQNNFASFEAHIVHTFQTALGAFLQTVAGQADRQKALYTDMVGTAQRIPGDFEWMNFLHRHGNIMIDSSAPKRDLSHIQYPNQEHASTKPLIAGTLERKSKLGALGGGYKAGYYVATPAKYLHQYGNDDFREDASPEMSLYLPDCTIGDLEGDDFNIKGKDASKKALAMSHEWHFRAPSQHEAIRWHEVISGLVGAAGHSILEPSHDRDATAAGAPPGVQTQDLSQGQSNYSADPLLSTTAREP